MMDGKKKALEELFGYLDQKDGAELSELAKPKGVGIEAVKVEKLGGEGEEMESEPGDVLALAEGESEKPEMDEMEAAELIEALKAALGE